MVETIKQFLIEQLHNNEFFKGGAAIAVLSALGFWLKSFFPWLWERVKRQFSYTMRIESKTDIYFIFNWWLQKNHSDRYKKVLISVECENKWKEDEVKEYKLKENNFESAFYFWQKRTPVFLQSTREKLEGAHYIDGAHIDSYTLTTYFNRQTLKNLISEVVTEYNSILNKKTTSHLMQYHNFDGWRKINNLGGKTFEKIFNSEKLELLEDLQQFFTSKALYAHRGTTFKRGYLCEGSPGNGKTSTIIALAQYLKKDVYSLNLTSLTDGNQLRLAFQGVKENSFILIEDADCMVNGREKINDKINFSELLNVVDGISSQEGICIFFTTNHPENLDPALIRCGRVDKQINFRNPKKEDVEGMLELFFGENKKLENYNNNHSAAQLQEFFIKSSSIEEAINKII
jgi:chaperone BCS1|nr:MAG TPA: ATPase [Caudoviricetes sp.]